MEKEIDLYQENCRLIAVGLQSLDQVIMEEIYALQEENLRIISRLRNEQLALMLKADFLQKMQILSTISFENVNEIIRKFNESEHFDEKLIYNILEIERLGRQ
jgi:hypothetical protein